jgi:2-methylcitrate dehydratase PrpD
MTTTTASDLSAHPITDEVAAFAISAKAADIPKDVAHLAKRSVIDGIGLAFAGARSECGHIAQRYLAALGHSPERGCTIIGTAM